MRTLYVHIGTPKTATTSIQMFCVENQKVLNKQKEKRNIENDIDLNTDDLKEIVIAILFWILYISMLLTAEMDISL